MSNSLLFPLHTNSICSLCGDTPNVPLTLLSVQDLERCSSALKIAVWVLETPKLEMIQYLKNFLAALSAPQCIQQVLLQSICQLAEQRPDACRKLLSHAEALKPELELQQLVQQAITRFLQTKGFVLHQDFQVDETGQWQLFNSAITSVLMELPKGDRLLITELLSLP